jgi:hypothetical protein
VTTSSSVYAVKFDEEKVVCGMQDSHIRVYDRKTSKLTLTLSGHRDWVGAVQYDDEKVLAHRLPSPFIRFAYPSPTMMCASSLCADCQLLGGHAHKGVELGGCVHQEAQRPHGLGEATAGFISFSATRHCLRRASCTRMTLVSVVSVRRRGAGFVLGRQVSQAVAMVRHERADLHPDWPHRWRNGPPVCGQHDRIRFAGRHHMHVGRRHGTVCTRSAPRTQSLLALITTAYVYRGAGIALVYSTQPRQREPTQRSAMPRLRQRCHRVRR